MGRCDQLLAQGLGADAAAQLLDPADQLGVGRIGRENRLVQVSHHLTGGGIGEGLGLLDHGERPARPRKGAADSRDTNSNRKATERSAADSGAISNNPHPAEFFSG